MSSYEHEAKELKRISETKDLSQGQQSALKRAALALIFVSMKMRKEFEDFASSVDQDLTEEERAHLRKLGLD
jgi:hypothetical protein